jgi:hypothetical protein
MKKEISYAHWLTMTLYYYGPIFLIRNVHQNWSYWKLYCAYKEAKKNDQ